jgi:signal transduction histidine kinase
VTIIGNKGYLEKMLINLIRNSITYGNKNGRTEVTAKASRNFLTINIKDNGIGISKEDLPHIFERFYRGDKAHTGRNNHSGLGLAIVKWIAETHGGEVKVKSTLRKGTTFSIILPIKRF